MLFYSEVVALSEKAISLIVQVYDQNLLLGKANYIYNIATRKGDVCIDNSLSLYCKNFSIEFIESQLLEHCKQRVKVIIEEP